ncbi:Ammonium transporter 1 [Fusarium beomiforme]|uniref:Ammonium transporter 1 n=1 Tax=Fusarium beomiforme TaxID=44412 RepID=A0A9P5AG18_9HYPO|nr:Ammonium transporter 1 [Fusarium beomiforme]
MVRSLSDESEHDCIGIWPDSDNSVAPWPRDVLIEDEAEKKKIPAGFDSPMEMINWLTNHEQETEGRLLHPVTDVPSVASVPSLNRSDETMSTSTRSVHEATRTSDDDDETAMTQRWREINLYHKHARKSASDSSSDISGRSSPVSCVSESGTPVTSPSSDGSDEESTASTDEIAENASDLRTHEVLFIYADQTYQRFRFAYDSDEESFCSDQDSQPCDADDNKSDTCDDNKRQEREGSQVGSCNRTEKENGLLQAQDQRPKRAAEDDENDHQQVSRSKKSKKQEDSHLRLACPFYKHDPIRYRRCHAHVLKRNSYVKQHLFRCHMQPVHCDICLSIWPNDEMLREHRRAQTCEKREYVAPDGITPEQERKLRSRLGSQNKSESDQWFELYSILFPDEQKPKSAYLNGELSEDAESLREFIEGRGTDLMMEELKSSGLILEEGIHSQEFQKGLQNALTTIFDGWHNQRKGINGDVGARSNKRLKSTPGEFPSTNGHGRARADTGSTNTTMTMVDDQNEGGETRQTTLSSTQKGEVVLGL